MEHVRIDPIPAGLNLQPSAWIHGKHARPFEEPPESKTWLSRVKSRLFCFSRLVTNFLLTVILLPFLLLKMVITFPYLAILYVKRRLCPTPEVSDEERMAEWTDNARKAGLLRVTREDTMLACEAEELEPKDTALDIGAETNATGDTSEKPVASHLSHLMLPIQDDDEDIGTTQVKLESIVDQTQVTLEGPGSHGFLWTEGSLVAPIQSCNEASVAKASKPDAVVAIDDGASENLTGLGRSSGMSVMNEDDSRRGPNIRTLASIPGIHKLILNGPGSHGFLWSKDLSVVLETVGSGEGAVESEKDATSDEEYFSLDEDGSGEPIDRKKPLSLLDFVPGPEHSSELTVLMEQEELAPESDLESAEPTETVSAVAVRSSTVLSTLLEPLYMLAASYLRWEEPPKDTDATVIVEEEILRMTEPAEDTSVRSMLDFCQAEGSPHGTNNGIPAKTKDEKREGIPGTASASKVLTLEQKPKEKLDPDITTGNGTTGSQEKPGMCNDQPIRLTKTICLGGGVPIELNINLNFRTFQTGNSVGVGNVSSPFEPSPRPEFTTSECPCPKPIGVLMCGNNLPGVHGIHSTLDFLQAEGSPCHEPELDQYDLSNFPTYLASWWEGTFSAKTPLADWLVLTGYPIAETHELGRGLFTITPLPAADPGTTCETGTTTGNLRGSGITGTTIGIGNATGATTAGMIEDNTGLGFGVEAADTITSLGETDTATGTGTIEATETTDNEIATYKDNRTGELDLLKKEE